MPLFMHNNIKKDTDVSCIHNLVTVIRFTIQHYYLYYNL